YQNGPSYTVLHKDTRQVTEADLLGCDAVVHLAELSNDPLGQLNQDLTFAINHRASVRLAELAKKAGVKRFVYSSSCSVYGLGEDGARTEESPVNPLTAYAKCKVLVERDVAPLADATFSPTFLRNATAFGASPRMRFDIVLNNLSGLAWTTRQIRMTSDGTPWRPLVHVLDICQAVACVLAAPRDAIHGQTFNVGDSRQNYRVREIAETVASAFPGCDLHFGSRDGDSRSYRVSFDKIQRHLPEFKCSYDAVRGAAQLHDVFSRIQMSQETFDSPPFTRLRQFQRLIASQRVDENLFWRN
ncbi:MAG: SDR family oxidoreductase, partial [Pirellulaceae bacterium]